MLIDSLRTEVAGRLSMVAELSPAAIDDAILIARQNKVLSLVHRRLTGGSAATGYLPSAAATMAANSAILTELCVIAPRLRAADLRYTVIKGPVQQKQLHGTFYQRPSADLDILVRHEDFAAAKQVLLGSGYAVQTPSLWWRDVLGEEHLRKLDPPHIAVDLHHRVHQPGTPAPYSHVQVFEDHETVVVNGIEIPTLTALDALLLCTISIAKALYNHEPSGAYLCDLFAGLMAGAPQATNSFNDAARRAGLAGHAALSLRLMGAVFAVSSDSMAGANTVLAAVPDDELLRMVFVPRDAATRWPKRRLMLWELCERQPRRYGREVVRLLGSELTRRMFERPDIV